jgi:hypothetical protein
MVANGQLRSDRASTNRPMAIVMSGVSPRMTRFPKGKT